MPANHTAIWLYSSAFALELAAAVCVWIDLARARDRAKRFRGLVAGRSLTISYSNESVHPPRRPAPPPKPGQQSVVVAGPGYVDRAVQHVAELTSQFADQTNENLARLTQAADILSNRRLARIGVTLLAISIVVGFLGYISSAGAFGH